MKLLTNKKLVVAIISYVLSLGIIGVLFFKIDLNKFKAVVSDISYPYLFVSIVFSFVSNFFIQTEKWRKILENLGLKIPFLELLKIYLGSCPLKVISPLKSGMLLRAVYLKQVYGFPLMDGTYSVILSMLLNLLAALVFVIAGMLVFESAYTLPIAAGFLSLGVGAAAFWYYRKDTAKRLSQNLLVPSLYSIALILFEVLNYKILAQALGVRVPLRDVFLLASVMLILANIPITIQGIGAREAMVCFFFAPYASFTRLFSLGLSVTVVEYVIPMLVGVWWTKRFIRKMVEEKGISPHGAQA